MMTENLKSCPFCGNDKIELIFADNEIQAYFIECKECRVRLDVNNGRQMGKIQTIEAWNKRAFEPVRGSWLLYEDKDTNAWECSVCHSVQQLNEGTPLENNWHYCPNCSAKMEKEIHE